MTTNELKLGDTVGVVNNGSERPHTKTPVILAKGVMNKNMEIYLMCDNDKYMAKAYKAAKAEREGNYYEAKHLWFQAGQLATLDTSKHWALAREKFCEYRHSKIRIF
ncbi:TPA: ANR family transcriptional regulator [Photobacterium damselae]